MSDSAGNWCLIESDPGVFTELIREFGMYMGALGKFIQIHVSQKPVYGEEGEEGRSESINKRSVVMLFLWMIGTFCLMGLLLSIV